MCALTQGLLTKQGQSSYGSFMWGDDGAESETLFWTLNRNNTIYTHILNASSYLFHHIGQQYTYLLIKQNLPPPFL